jgi:hypothetical protein
MALHWSYYKKGIVKILTWELQKKTDCQLWVLAKNNMKCNQPFVWLKRLDTLYNKIIHLVKGTKEFCMLLFENNSVIKCSSTLNLVYFSLFLAVLGFEFRASLLPSRHYHLNHSTILTSIFWGKQSLLCQHTNKETRKEMSNSLPIVTVLRYNKSRMNLYFLRFNLVFSSFLLIRLGEVRPMGIEKGFPSGKIMELSKR